MRNFDGTNDNVSFGSDASIDAFSAKTIMFWTNINTGAATTQTMACKSTNAGIGGWTAVIDTTVGVLQFSQAWSGTDGLWRISKPANGLHHVAITYAGSATTDNAVIYVDGVSQSVTTAATPTGSIDSDAANSLVLGELSAGGATDYNGTIGWLTYHSAVLDAAAVNRAKWWGRPHGGMVVYHPLVTDKLNNEGTGTANGTATGSAMTTGVPPVQRPGSGGGF